MVVVVVAAEDVAVVVVELVLVLLLEVFDLAGVALGGWKPRSLSVPRSMGKDTYFLSTWVHGSIELGENVCECGFGLFQHIIWL